MAERDDDFGGAHLPRNPPEATWVCVAQALSPDQQTLVRVYVSTLGYRVQSLRKARRGTQDDGLWWSEAAPPIVTASRDEAMQLMTTLSSADR
jgi:hypothetical protein